MMSVKDFSINDVIKLFFTINDVLTHNCRAGFFAGFSGLFSSGNSIGIRSGGDSGPGSVGESRIRPEIKLKSKKFKKKI